MSSFPIHNSYTSSSFCIRKSVQAMWPVDFVRVHEHYVICTQTAVSLIYSFKCSLFSTSRESINNFPCFRSIDHVQNALQISKYLTFMFFLVICHTSEHEYVISGHYHVITINSTIDPIWLTSCDTVIYQHIKCILSNNGGGYLYYAPLLLAKMWWSINFN